MDLTYTAQEEAFRAEARAWLEAHVPRDLPPLDSEEGFPLHLEWEKKLFAERWAVVSWPREYGGREASIIEWLIFEEEYYRAGGPQRATQNGIFLLAPTVFDFGTREQQERILPRMAAAEELWCQGWSEPGSGSDLASLSSRAERVEGGWRLHGQKTWCTRGTFSDKLFGLFRSDPDSERHRGLTYLLVDLKAEGVSVRPVDKLDGDEGFAEVFFDGAFVPDEDVLGEPGEGWRIAMATTGSERGLTLRSPGRFMATALRLIELYRRYRETCDPRLRERVVQAWTDAEAYRVYTLESVTRIMDDAPVGSDSSLMKLHWSEMDVRLHETALELIGPHAELDGTAPEAVDGGRWMKGYQFALSGPIYAGTNEIQRNVIAERILGLPRR
ncbi:MAG: acyl-CoA dehydrogenase family protein [Proteobacteria bacterium]|nr:acyl-CoA dehydrogenase family protein [Pseudomonadota bacterium]